MDNITPSLVATIVWTLDIAYTKIQQHRKMSFGYILQKPNSVRPQTPPHAQLYLLRCQCYMQKQEVVRASHLQQKYFSHPSLVIYSFATPPIKLKLGQQIGERTCNSKPPRPIIMMGQSVENTDEQSDHI